MVRAAVENMDCFSADGDYPDGIRFYGCSLVLNSSIKYRMYFAADSPALAAQYGLTKQNGSGLYYFDDVTSSITQLNQNKEYHIGDAEIVSNPMNYVKMVVNQDGEDDLINLMRALYDYYLAAMEYSACGTH